MGDLYNPYPRTPKNIRQIGEMDQTVRLYLEDYVNTYLKRLSPKGGQDLRVGVLLGTAEERDGTPFLFVDGAMEVEDVTEPGEKVRFTEQAWRKTYQTMEQMFPKRVVLGWFLCGAPGCTLSPLNYWQEHGKYFAAKNQLMYLSGGLDGEEAVYVAAEEGFCRLRGYNIYYERNQMMQDYMILRKDVRRVESGAGDPVIRDFRQRMEENKSQVTARHGTVRVLGGLCTLLGILVLAGGVTTINNYEKMKEMEAVLASVLPAGQEKKDAEDGQAGQVDVEEVAGGLQLQAGGDGTSQGNGGGSSGSGQEDEGSGTGSMAGDGTDGAGVSAAGGGSDVGVWSMGASVSAGGSGTAGSGANAETPFAGSGAAGSGSDGAGGGSVSTAAGMSGGNAGASGGNVGTAEGLSAGGGDTSQAQESGTTAAAAREVLAGQTLYLVQPGDTLYGICLDRYGDGSRMQEICELNGLENEDTITAGENLILP